MKGTAMDTTNWPRCKTCKHWGTRADPYRCKGTKRHRYRKPSVLEDVTPVAGQLFVTFPDTEPVHVELRPGPEFGCTHWQPHNG